VTVDSESNPAQSKAFSLLQLVRSFSGILFHWLAGEKNVEKIAGTIENND